MDKIWEITKVQVKHIKDQSKNRQEHANKGLEEKQAIEEHSGERWAHQPESHPRDTIM